MLPRRQLHAVVAGLARQPAVALIGPRQVGKTTLALEVAAMRPSVYLDLEDPAARARLADPALYFESHADDLVILDELQRVPELFALLRGIIDRGRRQGRRTGRFLLLGSASLALLRQASESLAGRIAQVELAPLDVTELGGRRSVSARWLRGGFPDSLLAADDGDSLDWRRDFLRTYLERDIPQLAPRVPTETLRRLWTMLAHEQGGVLNAARLAAGLGLSGQTIARYVDLLVDLMLVRRLPPLIANVGKRQVKGPRVYVRDSGLVHALLGIATLDDLLGHPIVGPSWEGFVIEQLIDNAAPGSAAGFYRTSAGAEIDLVIERPGGRRWAIEVKRSLGPSVTRGFHSARADLEVERAFVVYAGDERYPLADGVEVIGLAAMIEELRVS